MIFAFVWPLASSAGNLCKRKGSADPNSYSVAELTAKAKTIYVVRILARVQGRDRTAYRAEVVKTLKGTRSGEISFDMIPPRSGFPKDQFNYSFPADCQPRGNLVTGNLYVIYVDLMTNPESVVPVTSADDAKIDRIAALVQGKG